MNLFCVCMCVCVCVCVCVRVRVFVFVCEKRGTNGFHVIWVKMIDLQRRLGH